MVVFSAAILTKQGKVLVARQFVPMTKLRIEGLLAAFPKLLTGDTQHTFIETDSVRYVYQPLEQLYCVLVTNKASNILEDLETLRLLAKLVAEYCGGNTEEAVTTHAFELIFAWDEVISAGYKEEVTLSQIKTFTEMDSHEEKLARIIQESKMSEAKEAARRKAEQIDKQKMEMRRVAGAGYGAGGGGGASFEYGGAGSSYGGMGAGPGIAGPGISPSAGSAGVAGASGGGGWGSGTAASKKAPGGWSASASSMRAGDGKKPVRGMQLAKAKTSGTDDFLAALKEEEKLATPVAVAAAVGLGGAGPPGGMVADQGSASGPRISVDEKVLLQLDRDGAVKKMELKGEMKLTVTDPDHSRIVIHTNGPLKKETGFQCRLHPKVDKKGWNNSGLLGLTDPSSSFPCGTEKAPIILKWRVQNTDEDWVPFSVNFWPQTEDGRSIVSAEVTRNLDMDFTDILINIPCPSSAPPEIASCDGEYLLNPKSSTITWQIPVLNEEHSSATLEFSVPEIDADDFFPLSISFASPSIYSHLTVTQVLHVQTSEPVDFEQEAHLSSEKFSVE